MSKNCYDKGCGAAIMNGHCHVGHTQPPDEIRFENLTEAVAYLKNNGFTVSVGEKGDDVVRVTGPAKLITYEMVSAFRPFRDDLRWLLRNQRDVVHPFGPGLAELKKKGAGFTIV